jgi:hypothetical protein
VRHGASYTRSNTVKKSPKSNLGKTPPPKGSGGGYRLGPRAAKPIPADAVWMTSNQLRARYGGKSHMWIVRKLRNDPDFPKPAYDGRMQIFSVAEFDEYDRLLLSKRSG